VVVVVALVALLPATADAASSRSCGDVLVSFQPVGEGSAVGILATRASCLRARSVARLCLRDRLRGWKVSQTEPDNPQRARVRLVRGDAVVSFRLAGGGGCF
jgi:hypothetical protein